MADRFRRLLTALRARNEGRRTVPRQDWGCITGPVRFMKDRASRERSVLRVLGALLGDSAEESLLRQAIRGPIAFRNVENRFRVLEALREHAPDVIVFSVQDRNRLPTAPLISECAKARPGIRILLLCAAPPPRGGAVLAAARAGARVLIAPTSNELASILGRIARSLTSELALDCATLATVQPPMLRELLCAAAETVAGDGRVETLAQHLRVSTRTLSRYTRRTSHVAPRTVISVARLLWACALMESARRDAFSVAGATGFAGPKAMLVATRRYLAPVSADLRTASLPGYRDALQYIVGALRGHLAP